MLSKTQVKYIQSLSHKKFRDEEGVFIAEGPKIVEELLSEKPSAVRHIYALGNWMGANKNLVKKIVPECLSLISETELEKISNLNTPNQVFAILDKLPVAEDIDCKTQLIIALNGIQDPGNMGTIIRIADWFGIKHIICSKDCADVYNPKVVQSTMGSIVRVNIMYVDLEVFFNKQKNIEILAAALEGIPVQKMKGEKNGILLIGNESKGISDELFRMATKKITIPQIGKAESLNAAIATGIILSHLILK